MCVCVDIFFTVPPETVQLQPLSPQPAPLQPQPVAQSISASADHEILNKSRCNKINGYCIHVVIWLDPNF